MGTFEIEPSNEMQVREWFAAHLHKFRYNIVESVTGFPDYVLTDEKGKRYRVEAEYESANFVMHGHNPAECDFILCWKHTRAVSLPVLELSTDTFHPANSTPTEAHKYPRRTVDEKAQRFAQALRDKVKSQSDELNDFYAAVIEDMRAQSQYQKMLTAPRLALLSATRKLLQSIGESGIDPYDLLKMLSS